jgi:hypothetical protein
MPSGGARARTGPPKDPNALRRDRDKAEFVHLPATGRTGPTPPFPLDRPAQRELTLWEAEWRRPQAVIWELDGQHLEVALYVRSVVVAEGDKAGASDRAIVLRHMAELGITQGGLAKNRWIIDGQPQEQVKSADGPSRTSAKSRFKTIEGGAA